MVSPKQHRARRVVGTDMEMDILALLGFPHTAAVEVTVSWAPPKTLISCSIEVAVALLFFFFNINVFLLLVSSIQYIS